MAIRRSFGGQSISRPGAYSKSQTSSDAGTPLVSNDTLFLLGEADAGASGAEEGIQVFTASQFNQLVAKYRTGPIVDAAKAALVPSRTPGVNGAGRFLIWKTNTSVQASLALASSFATIKSREYGIGGNRITYRNTLSSESAIQAQSSADITAFGGLDTQTLIVSVDGGAPITVTYATPADISAVVAQTVIAGIDVTNTGDQLILTRSADANAHQNGYGRSFEILSTSTALANLNLTAGLVTPTTEPQATIELIQPRDGINELNTIGGDIAISMGHDGSDSTTAATVTITGTQMDLTATGSSQPAVTLTFENNPTIGLLVDAINALSGWTATVAATLRNQPSTTLDEVGPIGALSSDSSLPARIKRDSQAFQDLMSDSDIVLGESISETGLPDAGGRFNLAGGLKGASTSSNFDSGFSASLGQLYNVALPCISQDASEDILSGLTDPASTYDIETVQAMLDTHLRLRGSIKNRKEAQGMTGYRKQAKEDVYGQATTLGSSVIQMCMQDVLVVDSSNTLQWKQPHIFAALLAGIRLGTEVGEPATHKTLAVSGVGHFVNTSTGISQGDFDPEIDFELAIDSGVTFAEPFAGSFRITVDNTTYGIDENFVFNRGSVVEASQFIAKEVRRDAEQAFIGRKSTFATASSIKARIRSRLIQLFEADIMTPGDNAPQGFVEETFIVEKPSANTAEVQIECKPVQGLDFIFITFTLGDTQQSA